MREHTMAINLIDSVDPQSFAVGGFKEDASRSTTLPARWYYAPEVFSREREEIFFRTWSYQCHVSDLPNAGDYYVSEVLDQNILLIRDQNGALRAFYNVWISSQYGWRR